MQCKNCQQPFTITPDDQKFFDKMQVPAPAHCPECRFRRRLVWRNERALYRRPCDLCKKEKILMFQKSSPHKVFCRECWQGDGWNPMDYGRDFDFSRPFFDQWRDLLLAVPRPGIIKQGTHVGSEYTNRVSDNKNCHLIFGSLLDEDCYYGVQINECKNCIDGFNLHRDELCYECMDTTTSYNCAWCQECVGCRDSYFIFDCRNCENCFGCVNLRNKRYCMWNEQLTKEEYEKRIREMHLDTPDGIAAAQAKFGEVKLKYPHPAIVQALSENVSGNWLWECKNTFNSFGARKIENGKNLFFCMESTEVMDVTTWGKNSELLYECLSVGRSNMNLKFCIECWDSDHELSYCANCHTSSSLFGCIGIKGKQYCILNKQYTKEAYEALIPKIIEHMKKAGEYGEFFPAKFSPFAYNETMAQEYLPMSREGAEAAGYRWKEPEERAIVPEISYKDLPASSKDAGDIADKLILCEDWDRDQKIAGEHLCTKVFKIIPPELRFYKEHGLALPRMCPNSRHFERLARRNPLRVWPRACQCAGAKSESGSYANTGTHSHGAAPCPNKFETTYAPEREEIVYCETCYQSEVA